MSELNAHQTWALRHAARGFVVLPAHLPTGLGGGKVPISKDWQNSPRLTDEQIIETWAGQKPWNISVLTGPASGIFVLDIDPDNQGFETMKGLVAAHGKLPETYCVRTGSGGFHYYFQMPDFELRNSAGKLGPGIDTRGVGGQVIAAGSRSTKGAYTEVRPGAPILPAPTWMLELLRPKAATITLPTGPVDVGVADSYTERAVAANIERLERMREAATPSGSGYAGEPWDHTTYKVAVRLTELANSEWCSLTHDTVEAILLKHAPRDSGFTDERVLAKLESARTAKNGAGVPPPRGGSVDDSSLFEGFLSPAAAQEGDRPSWSMHSWDDFGNAERLIELYGERLRWVEELGIWLEYDGSRWVDSPRGGERAAMRMIEQLRTLEEPLYSEMTDPEDQRKEPKSQRENFRTWLKTQRSDGFVKRAASSVKTTGLLDARTSDFDRNVDLLNVRNGVVDLLSGALMPHEPAQMLRRRADVDYVPTAEAPTWEAFLERVMPDQEMRNYLQRIVGYSITGQTREQVIFLHHGVTANGKSVFLRVIEAVLGDLSQVIPPKTLLVKREDQHPTDIDRMEGKRFLQLSETPQGAQLDEALIKRLTGEESITARGMGKDFREFRITGKVHVVTNHLPHINHDEATMRRLRLVHWGVTIPEAQRDKTLAARIIATELPGVLAWAVRGAQEWHEHGLAAPVAAKIDTDDYIASEDTFGQWISDCELVSKDGHFTATAEIYRSYSSWCAANGVTPMGSRSLGKELSRRGFASIRYPGTGARGWQVQIKGSIFHVEP